MVEAERLFRLLAEHDVEFIVIGAFAATIHGAPLLTDDVDICARPDVANLARLARALIDMDAREFEPHKGDFADRNWSAEMLAEDTVWLLTTSYGRFDVMLEPAGTGGYPDLIKDAVRVEIADGLGFMVASLDDVIRSKEAAGREKDRQQLSTLRRLAERLR